MADAADEDPEVDALYALPLPDFVAARNQLAKAKKKLAPDLAEEIKKLPKPTASAWILNQLARRRKDTLFTLLSALDRARAVQLAALSGGSELSLREALREEREAAADLEASAAELLVGTPHAAIEKALRGLRNAALDPAGRRLLERGRLGTDYEEPGFGALTSEVPIVPLPPPPNRDTELDRRRKEAEDERRRAAEVHAEEAERQAKKKRKEALETQLAQIRDLELRLLTEVQNADRGVTETRRRLEEAERRATSAREKAAETTKKREELEAKLRAEA